MPVTPLLHTDIVRVAAIGGYSYLRVIFRHASTAPATVGFRLEGVLFEDWTQALVSYSIFSLIDINSIL